jgi:hypothetical protein
LHFIGSDGAKGLQHVINDIFKQVMVKGKKECEGASQAFVVELQWCFIKHEIITSSLNVVYHNYRLEIQKRQRRIFIFFIIAT